MKKNIAVAFFVFFAVGFSAFVAKADTFNNNLYYGISGSTDVSQLQEFLTTQKVYSGPISGNFYSLTLAAVKAFQASQGISPAAGYFGPATRAKVNAIIDQQIQASNGEAVSETGSMPPTTTTTTNTSSPLQAQLNALMQQLAGMEKQLQTQQGTTTPTPTTITSPSSQSAPTTSSGANAWTSFSGTMFNSYANDPSAYTGQSIEMKGEVVDFLPLGGRGGSHNYIEVGDPNAYTSEPVMLEIDNSANYLQAVNEVRKTDLIAAYGTGIGTAQFIINGQHTSVPVLDITRLDDVGGCDIGGCLVSSDAVIFPGGATPLTTPQNSMSSSLSSSTTPSPTPSPTPTPIVTTNTNQCNFNGNIFTCTSSPSITLSPTSLPNATLGVSYGQTLTVSDPNTSSKSFRWNIISGQLPPGIELVFSPSQALACSGTYCFFTTSPNGLSYSANTPGYFYGTPTSIGTYTFTLQAIDSLNYVALPSFTMTVGSPIATTPTSTIPASSTAATYTITASAGTGGTISPAGTITVNAGSNRTFTIAANSGYQNNGKLVDGVNLGGQIGTTDSYTFINITANHTIQAVFTKGTDATLGSLSVSNGNLSPAFYANTYNYTVTLPQGTTAVPTVSFRTNDSSATGVVTQATSLPGTATVVVMAQDGIEKLTYTVNFVVPAPLSFNIQGTVANSNSPQSTSQCNVAGNVFTCTSTPNITVSLASSLASTPSGVSYVQPITVNDPNTTSQSYRWNIISGQMPPGIGIAFSSNQAIECSDTNCFFTAPPSELSYPANTPGEFFGTPTAAGNYSFTLQGIDNSNDFTLPTFTMNVMSSISSSAN